MKIGLIDVDGHNFPNLPLMKLSAWHKQKGDFVEKYDPMIGGHYDRVYMSKVFTFTPDYQYNIFASEIVKSGTGYFYPDGGEKLPDEIEHIYPDYGLYRETDTAYGFLTRGCPRNCEFCIVSKKEGRLSRHVGEIGEFWKGQKTIKLLDPNITACTDCVKLFRQIVPLKAEIDFTQGIDIRCMDEEKALLLNQMKIKQIHFAWDNYEFNTYDKLKEMRPLLNYDERKLRVYVLTNFNTTIEQDLERIYKLRELGYCPYTMIYNKELSPQEIRQIARWTNSMWIWQKCKTFEEYKAKPDSESDEIAEVWG